VEKVAGGVTTTWTYDDQGIHRQVTGASTLKFVHGPGIDEPVATDNGTSLSYFHADSLGSVVKTTSAAGSVTFTRQYDAYGTLQAGTATPGHAFTAREWDPESNLYYYRARYFDPRIGRFLSEDSAGQVNGPNLYAYVEDDPINNIDPSGHYTVNTGDKRFDKKIHDAMDKIQEELLNAPPSCGCMKWFMDRDKDLITLSGPGGPPNVTYNKQWGPRRRGEAHGTTGIELNYDMVMFNDPCYLAGVILHEMGHLAGWSGSHPDEGLDKACTFGCVKTPRGGGQ
jgi:RHS repeat-associated protein